MLPRTPTVWAFVALVVLLSAPASAADGALEINQACVATGCFPGDDPGFPVGITTAGAYRLTSNLLVPAATHGIDIQADGVRLDLGGFRIEGPIRCSGGCPPPGVGAGIWSAGRGTEGCSVANGSVVGFAADGVRLGALASVHDLTVTDVAGIGLSLSGGSVVVGNRILRTGSSGILF